WRWAVRAPGEVVEGGADCGVVGAQRLFGDREVALVERLGLGVPALGAIEFGEVVEGLAEGGVVGAQRLLGDRQVAPVERLGLGVPALSLVNICQPGMAAAYSVWSWPCFWRAQAIYRWGTPTAAGGLPCSLKLPTRALRT